MTELLNFRTSPILIHPLKIMSNILYGRHKAGHYTNDSMQR